MNPLNEILEFVEKPVDVRRLIERLSFDLDNFEDEGRKQPRLYLEAGRYHTQIVLRRARLELQTEALEAELGIGYKKTVSTDKKPLTDKGVANRVQINPERLKAREKLALAEATEVWSKQLLEAYRQREQMLKMVGGMRQSEISSELRAAKEKGIVDQMNKRAKRVRDEFDGEDQ